MWGDKDDGGLFGKIARQKGLLSDAQLQRALRLQEEVRAVGLSRPLGQILQDEGILGQEQVDLVLRLQALNQRARFGKRFGAIAVKNGLLGQEQLEAALREAQAEGWQRGIDDVLVARGDLDPRSARAVQAAMQRAMAKNGGGAPDDGPSRSATGRLTEALEVDEDADPAVRAAQLRVRDLTFAAVALREGLVRVPELERAVIEQLLREEVVALEDVLVERGVLAREEVADVAAALEASRHEKLVVPGYEVREVLGYGVTSIVLEARHTLLERDVAIKLFRAEHIASTTAEELIEEARTIAKIRHPNVVGLYEVGRVHRRLYYVMELVDGPTLADTIRTWGGLPERDALEMARDVARGLEEVHRHGLVHRDVKPQNILFTRKGEAKLTDLGLARQQGRLDEVPGAIYGSPYTMSPEQANGDPVDVRADLYGLGATLFFALCEQPPYDGPDPISIMMAHMTAPVPDPRERRAELSPEVCDLVRRLLAKAPEERPADAGEVLRAIDGILAFSS